MRLQFVVDVELHGLAKDLVDLAKQHGAVTITDSVKEALGNELVMGEAYGFFHPLADELAIKIIAITPKA